MQFNGHTIDKMLNDYLNPEGEGGKQARPHLPAIFQIKMKTLK